MNDPAADQPPNPPPAPAAPGDGRTQFQVDRLAFFSDAVFAIAITLLALNIHAPSFSRGGPPAERDLAVAVAWMVPRILGFVLSFLVIGTYWRAHHRLFRWVRGYDGSLVQINLLLLLAVSFIPAPTGFYSDYPDYRTPLIFYAASLAVVGVMNHLLWRYLIRHPELLDPATPLLEMRLGAGRSLVIPASCALAISLSFVDGWLARAALLSIPLWLRVYTRLTHRLAYPRAVSLATAPMPPPPSPGSSA